jgi:hypothetical protein
MSRIGQQSTHAVQCVVCDQKYGNAQEHRCPFAGVDHANMHRETNARIVLLTEAVQALVERVRRLESPAGGKDG